MNWKSFFSSIKPRIFLELMLFYWVLVLIGLVPNPFAEGQWHSYALYTLAAAAFDVLFAWTGRLGRKPDDQERREQPST